jgi:DNA-directed RNA polymerase subunit beta
MPQASKAVRVNFGKAKVKADYPNLLDIQRQSFKEFFQVDTTQDLRNKEELYRVFEENFPISDARNIFLLGVS